ncbi:tetratricopeptide repeat protein [Enterovibrio coralii]|uniref:tetratricopeptide repeat protein n=1 Tax=Enterovibrio coralii TaxID=294935 RepID=UPI001E330C6F|nr:tetratricopeptide repeat protein [Enterovibrio coralii]
MVASNNPEQAKQLFQAVISVAGDVPEALLGLARLHIQEDKHALALQTLSRAEDRSTPNKEIFVLLCHTAIKIEDYRAAREYCQFSIKQWPDEALLCRLMLLTYLKEENWVEAYRRAKEYIRLFPNDADIRYRLANASFNQLKSRHNFTREAILECQRLIESATALANDKSKLDLSRYLAEVLWYKGEAREAKVLLETYMAQYPDDVDSGFNSSFVYRSLEEWDDYYRTNEMGIESGKRLKYRGGIPQWDLNRPKDDVVLVMPEQGVGDELLYLHNLDIVLDNCKKAYVACDPRLEELVQASFPSVHTIPITRSDNQDIQIPESVLDEADAWIAGGSLAALCYREYGRHVFRTGYINTPESAQSHWKGVLNTIREANPGKPLIGICWRSGLAAASRNMHYLVAEETAHLLKQLPDAVFINLQYGECKKELDKMAKLTGTRVLQLDGLDLRDDFTGTASVIAELDAVITAGTAVHRLTTAVGTPCHVYFAGTNESDYATPRQLSDEKEIGYFYPPMMENKYPLIESMATNIKKHI